MADKANKEKLWHRRHGNLGEENLKRLAKDKLVEHFNYNEEKSIDFCKTCVGGKHHRTHFTITIKTHRRRKMLKVRWAQYVVACEARAKFYDHAHFVSNHAHFCTIKTAIASFLMKK